MQYERIGRKEQKECVFKNGNKKQSVIKTESKQIGPINQTI